MRVEIEMWLGYPPHRRIKIASVGVYFKITEGATSTWRLRYEVNHFQWQKSYHDHFIRDNRDFKHHYNYISYNPQKHGLPDDWPYVFTNSEYEDLV